MFKNLNIFETMILIHLAELAPRMELKHFKHLAKLIAKHCKDLDNICVDTISWLKNNEPVPFSSWYDILSSADYETVISYLKEVK